MRWGLRSLVLIREDLKVSAFEDKIRQKVLFPHLYSEISMTSPIDIYVPTRAWRNKGFFCSVVGKFEYQMKFDVNICKQISFLFWTLVLVWLGLEATTTCTAVWCSSLICKNQSQSRFIHCILYSTMFFLGQDSRNYEHYQIQAIGITI